MRARQQCVGRRREEGGEGKAPGDSSDAQSPGPTYRMDEAVGRSRGRLWTTAVFQVNGGRGPGGDA